MASVLEQTPAPRPSTITAEGLFTPSCRADTLASMSEGERGPKFFQQKRAQNDPSFFSPITSDNIYGISFSEPPLVGLDTADTPPVVDPFFRPADSPSERPSEVLGLLLYLQLKTLWGHRMEATRMALCRRCIQNGVKRDGGPFGVCRYHARTKCRVCDTPSLGEELCAPHAHAAEIMRWKAKSQLKIANSSQELADEMELRRARLLEAKFLAHQAVEVIFHSLLGAIVAIWAGRHEWEKFKLKSDEEDVA